MQCKSFSTVCLVVFCLFSLPIGLFAESIRSLDKRIQAIETELQALPVREPGESGGNAGLFARQGFKGNKPTAITIDLEAVYPIDHIALIPTRLQNAKRQFKPAGFPIRFEIFGSLTEDFSDPFFFYDGKNKDYPDPNGYPVIFQGDRHKIRFLRIVVHKVTRIGRTPGASFAELFIFSDGRNVALRKPVKSSRTVTWKNYFHDTFLVDGQTSMGQPLFDNGKESVLRGWHGAIRKQANSSETVEVVFEYAHEIDEIRLYPVHHTGWPDGTAYGFPVHFKVQIKEEDSDWITVEDWSERPFPNPGNNPVYFPLKKHKAQAIRLQALRLPKSIPTDYIFALAELEVYAEGTNIAPQGEISTSFSYKKHPTEWNESALNDGYGSRGKIIPLQAWLEGLARRGQLEAELALLTEQRTQQQDRLARNLRNAVRVLIGALLLAGALMVRNKRRRRELLRELKNTIASDLHDEVGSNLASITILAAGAKEQVKPQSPQEHSLQRMIDIANETSSSMRDIVWMLHPDRKANMSLTAKLQDIAGSLLADINFSFASSNDLSAHQLSMDTLHHLLLFYKETLHNLARHSGAREVNIILSNPNKTIRLEIIDNGTSPSSGALPNGLKLRAEKMQARLTYQTQADQNHLVLELP